MFNANRTTGRQVMQPTKSTMKQLTTQSIFSVKSTVSQSQQANALSKEMVIAKKISDHFKDQEQGKSDQISQTIFDDNLKVYKQMRKEFEPRITELIRDRAKLQKRKKATREKERLLRLNTIERISVICKVIRKTYQYYERLFMESDQVRLLNLYEAKYQFQLEKMEEEEEDAMSEMSASSAVRSAQAAKEQELQLLYESVMGDKSKSILEMEKQEEEKAKSPPKEQKSNLQKKRPMMKKQVTISIPEPSPNVAKKPEPAKEFKKEKTPLLSIKQPRTRRESRSQVIEIDNRSQQSSYSKMSKMSKVTRRKKSSMPAPKPLRYVIYHRRYKVSKLMEDPAIKGSQSTLLKQLVRFIDSPFRADKQFVIHQIVQMSRDSLEENLESLNSIFYDKIYKLFTDSADENNILKAFEILGNMMDSQEQRQKLVEKRCIRFILKKVERIIIEDSLSQAAAASTRNNGKRVSVSVTGRVIERTARWYDSKSVFFQRKILEKFVWISSLLAYHHEEFHDEIMELNTLKSVLRLVSDGYSLEIRQMAIMAIFLFTLNDRMYEQMIQHGVIEKVLELCMDTSQDPVIQEFAILSIVHFALNKQSVQELIDRGVMKLFDTFKQNEIAELDQPATTPAPEAEKNKQKKEAQKAMIQTNVSWIFLALSNNGIPGKEMLSKGITRDMFLVSCNPQFEQIRYLVITSFAVLGKSIEGMPEPHSEEKKRIKDLATSSQHQIFQGSSCDFILDILLQFSVAKNMKVRRTAYIALQDYIMSQKRSPTDLPSIIQAFLVGSISGDKIIQRVCANSISFLVTHRIVYHSLEFEEIDVSSNRSELEMFYLQILNSSPEVVLDAIMFLSGSEIKEIRATAFSTLSSLAQYSSKDKTVMCQIQRDIEFSTESSSSNSISLDSSSLDIHNSSSQKGPSISYLQFITERLGLQKDEFEREFYTAEIEEYYSGLFSLLRLAQEPIDSEISLAVANFIKFIGFVQTIQEKVQDFINKETDSQSISESSSASQGALNSEIELIELTSKECKLLETIQQNEKYYIDVFQALKHCDNQDLLCQLMKIVHFYSKQSEYLVFLKAKQNTQQQNYEIFHGKEDPCRCLRCVCSKSKLLCAHQIVNPHTILWLLEIFKKQSKTLHNKYLSCICSSTLLNIVDKNDIAIGYQEQAIIKMFNKVLQNIEVFDQDDGKSVKSQVSFSDKSTRSRFSKLNSFQIFGSQENLQEPDFGIADEDQLILEEQSDQSPSNDSSYSESVDHEKNKTVKVEFSQQSENNESVSSDSDDNLEIDLSRKMVAAKEQQDRQETSSPSRLQTWVSTKSINSQPEGNSRNQLLIGKARSVQYNSQMVTNRKYEITLESVTDDDMSGSEQVTPQTTSIKISAGNHHSRNFPTQKSSGSLKSLFKMGGDSGFETQRQMTTIQSRLERIDEHNEEHRYASGRITEIASPKSSISNSSQVSMGHQEKRLDREVQAHRKESIAFRSVLNFLESEKEFVKKVRMGKMDVFNRGSAPGKQQNKLMIPLKTTYVSKQKGQPRRQKFKKRSKSNKQLKHYISREEPSPKKLGGNFNPLKDIQKQQQMLSGRRQSIQVTSISKPLLLESQGFNFDHEVENTLDDDFNSISRVMDQIFILKDSNYLNDQFSQKSLIQYKNIELFLRDSLIKSFMIIFTNEQSQHLLLNYDLIDIAFNCMQSSLDITLETQRNVARLASMILKFPKVQKKLMNPVNDEVIVGMSNLLNVLTQSDYQFKSFLSSLASAPDGVNPQSKKVIQLKMKIHTIKYMLDACTLVSYNRKFIQNEDQSERVLVSMIQLLNCPHILICLDKDDMKNVIEVINNILKCSEALNQLFFSSRRDKEVMQILRKNVDNFRLDAILESKVTDRDKARNLSKVIQELFKNTEIISDAHKQKKDKYMEDVEDIEDLEVLQAEGQPEAQIDKVETDDIIKNLCLQIIQGLTSYDEILVSQFEHGAIEDLISIVQMHMKTTENWCLFRTQFQTKQKYVEFLNQHHDDFNLKTPAETHKPRVPKLKMRKVLINNVKEQLGKRDDSSSSLRSSSFKITEEDNESNSENNDLMSDKRSLAFTKSQSVRGTELSQSNRRSLGPASRNRQRPTLAHMRSFQPSQTYFENIGAKQDMPHLPRRESLFAGSMFSFQQAPSPPKPPEPEEVDLIEVENVEEQEREELQSNFKMYSSIMESRYYLVLITSNLLRRPCILHKEMDCPIKNTLYYKFDIIEIMVTDLHILALKLNEIHKIKRERQEAELRLLYEKAYKFMRGKAKPQTAEEKQKADKQALINQLLGPQNGDTNKDSMISDEQLDSLETHFNNLFHSFVDCFRAFNVKRSAIRQVLLKEERRQGLISFIEKIDSREQKFTIFYVVSSMLIELVTDRKIQLLLFDLKMGRTHLEDITYEDFFSTMKIVSSTVERLFGLADKIDTDFEKNRFLHVRTGFVRQADDVGKTFKDEVLWLVETLKIEIYLEKKMEQKRNLMVNPSC